MRSTFKVLFYLKRNAPKKNGLVPVMFRIQPPDAQIISTRPKWLFFIFFQSFQLL